MPLLGEAEIGGNDAENEDKSGKMSVITIPILRLKVEKQIGR